MFKNHKFVIKLVKDNKNADENSVNDDSPSTLSEVTAMASILGKKAVIGVGALMVTYIFAVTAGEIAIRAFENATTE